MDGSTHVRLTYGSEVKSANLKWSDLDLNRFFEILRMLQPRQEKVIRLYFGLGCQRCHSALEIAEAFEVASQVIAGILGAGIQSGPPLEQRRSSGGKARWLRDAHSETMAVVYGGVMPNSLPRPVPEKNP